MHKGYSQKQKEDIPIKCVKGDLIDAIKGGRKFPCLKYKIRSTNRIGLQLLEKYTLECILLVKWRW